MTVVASKRKVKVIHKVKKNSSSISESLNFLAKNKWRKNLKRLKNRFQKGIQKKLAQLEQSTSIGTGSSTFAKHLSSLDNLLVEKIDNERKKLDDVSKKLTEVTEFLGVVANMSSSSSPTAPEKKKNKRSIESVEFMDKPWQLDIDSNGTILPIVYDAATLRTKYNLDSKPKLANQGKKAGQCAFQAYIGLLRSITSIGYGHEFAKEEVVRSRMIGTVKRINKLLKEDKQLDSRKHYLQPGDESLENFSVHAFKTMNQDPYRLTTMTTGPKKAFQLLPIEWLLRQSAGYFIVFGNRLPIGDKNFDSHFHFLGVNIEKGLVLDNKTAASHLRLCRATFDKVMPTTLEILRLEKLDESANMFRVRF